MSADRPSDFSPSVQTPPTPDGDLKDPLLLQPSPLQAPAQGTLCVALSPMRWSISGFYADGDGPLGSTEDGTRWTK